MNAQIAADILSVLRSKNAGIEIPCIRCEHVNRKVRSVWRNGRRIRGFHLDGSPCRATLARAVPA